MQLQPGDARLDWRGVVEFEPADPGWWQPWRLPFREAATASAGNLLDRAKDAAGVRLVAGSAALRLTVRGTPEAPLDLLVGGALVERIRLAGERTITVPIGGELWLPQFGHVQVGPVDAEDELRASGPLTRWTAYGSSITQCRGADGPSETWPALVARGLGWDVTALGFGGECHLDPIAAATVRDRPADLISLCVGINIHGHSTFSARTLLPAVVGFVDRIRERQSCPVLVVGPIASPPNERRANDVGLALEDVRDLVQEGARRTGSAYLDGRDLIDLASADLLVDGVHPGQDGYRRIAERIAPVLASLVRPSPR